MRVIMACGSSRTMYSVLKQCTDDIYMNTKHTIEAQSGAKWQYAK